MTFQAYLDTVYDKTGKRPDDFVAEASEKGWLDPLVKASEVKAWLAAEYGLGPGHAMAIYSVLKTANQPRPSTDERLAKNFAGAKARWQPLFDALVARLDSDGAETGLAATDSYVSLLKGTKKFAVAAFTADRFDLGLKLPGETVREPFEPAGSWNSMVTHRLRITDAEQIDDEVYGEMRRAYDRA
ncbi:DUF4287 domain-containing protein [Subtercola endophyticus]|uniref:DUF4287 domain-containing protein n=1 Tax=Subtercola endophyticus TaxID=2895559 RepID=UPI001E658E80|nr:DUF4287 domain-containing protein [Subtercola endophyticus]UFS57763.1 DUF4287 domain-containing protein [Subtercola endophyticus]